MECNPTFIPLQIILGGRITFVMARISYIFGNKFLLSLSLSILLLYLLWPMPLIKIAFAHFAHLPHYNGSGLGIGNYYVYQAIDPEYTPTDQPARMSFSIQDYNGNDVKHRILTMVEIYSERTGERIAAYPWTMRMSGDFDLYNTFRQVGNYQIVLSISDNQDKTAPKIGTTSPTRDILSSNQGCNCDRGVFNISVTNTFGDIFVGAVSVGVVGIIVVFGIILGLAYRNRKSTTGTLAKPENKYVLKYIIMLLAIAAGFVHLAVYAEHGSLRIEYSIFLLVAGGCQFAYGMLYTLLTVTGRQLGIDSIHSAVVYYRKTLVLNLFGLLGTGVLLGLYIYSIVLPPPLSPNNSPEDIDLGGILDKVLEACLVIGIIYLMRWEKKQLQAHLVHIT
jgi:hypothetical protein